MEEELEPGAVQSHGGCSHGTTESLSRVWFMEGANTCSFIEEIVWQIFTVNLGSDYINCMFREIFKW